MGRGEGLERGWGKGRVVGVEQPAEIGLDGGHWTSNSVVTAASELPR